MQALFNRKNIKKIEYLYNARHLLHALLISTLHVWAIGKLDISSMCCLHVRTPRQNANCCLFHWMNKGKKHWGSAIYVFCFLICKIDPVYFANFICHHKKLSFLCTFLEHYIDFWFETLVFFLAQEILIYILIYIYAVFYRGWGREAGFVVWVVIS